MAVKGALLLRRGGLPESQGKIVGLDLIELLGHYAHNGIAQAETRQKQGRASPYAYHRHKETLFIAEQITGRNLFGKAEALPYKAYFLQEHSLARGRSLRPYKPGGTAL